MEESQLERIEKVIDATYNDVLWDIWKDIRKELSEALKPSHNTASTPCPHHVGKYVSDKTCYLVLFKTCGNQPCQVTRRT